MLSAAFVLAAAAAIPGPSGALGEGTPSCELYRLPDEVAAPRIDGVLDDEAWREAALLGELTQVEPIAGAAPSEATRVRLAYDATALYVALECDDREPARIRATQMQRDADLDPDDRVEILIDTFLDRRNAFWFQIGAAGSLGDALVTRNGSAFNKRWDGIWSGVARVTEAGWQAELAIPMATLNFDPAGSAWGFNLRRHIRRRTEEVRWASPEPRVGFFSVANAGTLTGLRGLHQGLGLDLKPFAVLALTRDRSTDDSDVAPDAGLDLFYRWSPSVKLSLSFNTDFAETEVDSRQVNLTRFPLYFPEKRDFFLEDSGAFEFGTSSGFGATGDVIPFFSRRIGLDAANEEVPLLAAAKLTGRSDGWGFGLLDVETDRSGGLERQNLFAGRVTRDLLEQSDVGLIWTHGDPTRDGRADTYGVDLNLRTDEFLGDQNLRFSTFALQSEIEGGGSDDAAWGARVSYPNDVWEWSAGFTAIGEDFDPRLGFVQRTGIEKREAALAWSPRINAEIRQLEFSVEPTWIAGRDGEIETERLEIQPFGAELESGDELRLELESSREVLAAPFAIHTGVTIPPGDYRFERARLEVESSDKRDVSGGFTFEAGDFFDGEATGVSLFFDLRASTHVLFGAELERDVVDLPAGEFSVDVVRARLLLLASPRLSWSNLVQWDDDSEEIGLNSRAWWILAPGSEAFVVLNQGWEHADGSLAPTVTSAAVKLGYTLRF